MAQAATPAVVVSPNVYIVPESGDTAFVGLTGSLVSCSNAGGAFLSYVCKGKISGAGSLAGWATGNGTTTKQVGNRLNLQFTGKNVSTNATVLSRSDYCAGASAGLSQCKRYLPDTTFNWVATRSNGYPGATICIDLVGSATYQVTEAGTKKVKSFYVSSSAHQCLFFGARGGGTAAVPVASN